MSWPAPTTRPVEDLTVILLSAPTCKNGSIWYPTTMPDFVKAQDRELGRYTIPAPPPPPTPPDPDVLRAWYGDIYDEMFG